MIELKCWKNSLKITILKKTKTTTLPKNSKLFIATRTWIRKEPEHAVQQSMSFGYSFKRSIFKTSKKSNQMNDWNKTKINQSFHQLRWPWKSSAMTASNLTNVSYLLERSTLWTKKQANLRSHRKPNPRLWLRVKFNQSKTISNSRWEKQKLHTITWTMWCAPFTIDQGK